MSRRYVTNAPYLLSSIGAVLLVLSAGVTAQRFLPSLEPAVVPEKLKSFVPVTDDMLVRPKPENWISYRNGYSLWGYSSLNQINAGNVGQLRLAWSRAMQPGPQEVEPLVYDGIMFLVNGRRRSIARATNGDLLFDTTQVAPHSGMTGTQFIYRNVRSRHKISCANMPSDRSSELERFSGDAATNYQDQVAQPQDRSSSRANHHGSLCLPQEFPGCFITAHDTMHARSWRSTRRPGRASQGGQR